ncbi:ketopantoate reductase family protein [Agromyces archimandritae]|uniref:2-dehydropantoate 2-reductase n=1 Tax=Agromyces archimandritae TaxID=2781962 RepID=A0A975FJC3_9MICO|nr:2-dehydropantoate 2-reductase [Agromyces archimandritae]QTX03570.1 2-dehydropantoate 2-reductase [Agromyces archimandritae]
MPAPESQPQPVFAVVGPGAVGGLLAALLRRAGADVVVVAREASARRIAERGLTITSGRYGEWISDVPAVTEVPAGAHVILAVKAYALGEVIPQLAAAHPAEVLTLLNGVDHLPALAGALPGTDVIGAAITIEAARTEPTVLEHRSSFARVTVPERAAGSPIATALADAGVAVTAAGTDAEVLWTKLRFLATFALLTSRTETGIGEALAADPGLADALIEEIAAVASAEGVPTDAGELRASVHGMPAGMRSSLQHDFAAGGPTELDAIGGAVARAARAHGIRTPALDATLAELAAR